jgi:hypothetical protein
MLDDSIDESSYHSPITLQETPEKPRSMRAPGKENASAKRQTESGFLLPPTTGAI